MSNLSDISVATAASLDRRYGLFKQIQARIKNLGFHEKIRGSTQQSINHRQQLFNLVNRLVKYYTIPHADLAEIAREFKKFGTTTQHMEQLFKRSIKPTSRGLSIDEKQFMKKLKHTSTQSRIQEIRYRIESETTEAAESGWYILFQTLTVSNHYHKKVFSKGSRAWADYIRDVERFIGTAIYGTVKKAEIARSKGHKYHKYFAVVERGPRLHIHVIHYCKDLPGKCKRDPNIGPGIPYKNQILGWSHLWRYGYDTPIAVRFEANDAFTKLGWRWPHIQNEITKIYEPREAKPPIALARYVSKYVSEEYATKNKETFRCKMTRQLGMKTINQLMDQISDDALLILMTIRDNGPLKHLRRPPPLPLVRKAATREILIRLPSKTVWMTLQALKPAPTIIAQYRTMIRPMIRPKSPNIGDTTLKNPDIGITDTSKEWREISDVWKNLTEAERSGFRPAGPFDPAATNRPGKHSAIQGVNIIN